MRCPRNIRELRHVLAGACEAEKLHRVLEIRMLEPHGLLILELCELLGLIGGYKDDFLFEEVLDALLAQVFGAIQAELL